MSRRTLCLFALVFVYASSQQSARAQGLIWNAPAEGTQVQFEGEFIQEDERPDDVNKRIKLEWLRRITLKALNKTTAPYNGNPNAECQWFEIEVVTGTEVGGDGTLVLGPGGQRIYKILVPLERANIGAPVDGKVVDPQNIPIAYLPIVKGFRRIDEQAATPITSGVFNTYPMVTLLGHFRDLDIVAQETDPQVSLQSVSTATQYHGELTMESPTSRSVNKADVYANASVPFGLVRWKVELTREAKDGKAPRDQYTLKSTINVDMKIVSQSTGATSKLQEGGD